MPRKRQAAEDSDELASSPVVKKSKSNDRAKVKATTTKTAKSQDPSKSKDSDGNTYWEACFLKTTVIVGSN